MFPNIFLGVTSIPKIFLNKLGTRENVNNLCQGSNLDAAYDWFFMRQ